MQPALLLIAIGLASVAAWLALRRLFVLIRGTEANGTVVDYECRQAEDSIEYHPVVVFIDNRGQSTRFTSGTGSSGQEPTLGSAVAVRYRADAPEIAYINTFRHLWAQPLVLLIASLVCFTWWLQSPS
jgi:Protein of unknown function (DUF3592)